ncbi:multidrug effflux MFS transporter [Bosea caraganae]|nr:multidrug effflux MFS transporter [Bosea caraganae]
MTETSAAVPRHGMGFYPFVSMMAALMATNALAIDAMLPALPQIGAALGITEPNDRQWIITAYLLGFGVSQIIYGTLSDRFGRRPVLMFGLVIYVAASVLASFAGSFQMMMFARVLQGVGAAATRVLAVSIVRDCYSGRDMARVMSLAMIVFLAVPILAPSIGQAILWVAPWRWIFGVLTTFGAVVLLWAALKLPETQHPEDRKPIEFRSIVAAFRVTLTTRISVGYMLAMGFVLGGLFGFINSAQQVFGDVFHALDWFTTIFALIAGCMAVASLVNARIVGRLGMRRVSHGALLGFIGLTGLHAILAASGHEYLWLFAILQGGTMFCFGLLAPNFNAMAMDPLGHVAGTASSVQGFVTTVGGALLGFYIGQHFNGTVVPLTLGFSICGVIALVIVLIAEKGRLFHPAAGRS